MKKKNVNHKGKPHVIDFTDRLEELFDFFFCLNLTDVREVLIKNSTFKSNQI